MFYPLLCCIVLCCIHLAQLSNLIGPFVQRDRPEKTIGDAPKSDNGLDSHILFIYIFFNKFSCVQVILSFSIAFVLKTGASFQGVFVSWDYPQDVIKPGRRVLSLEHTEGFPHNIAVLLHERREEIICSQK